MAPSNRHRLVVSVPAHNDGSRVIDSFLPQHVDEPLLGSESTTTNRCQLLELPPELRAEIFGYVLPITVNHGFKGPCWIKGTTALLRTSKQIHNEAAQLMYSRATFVINLVWDCTTFACQCLLPSDSFLRKDYAFPDFFRKEYLSYMRKFNVVVHHRDSHIGWIEQCSTGLTLGVRDQLGSLCTTLETFPQIRRLRLHFRDSFVMSRTDEAVLRPIATLRNVQSIQISGDISAQTQMKFQALVRNQQHVKIVIDDINCYPTLTILRNQEDCESMTVVNPSNR
ncbi:MAG: hypothetical protein Q9166_004313 [cf. Caloplaca sp. 2 TL-2023]